MIGGEKVKGGTTMRYPRRNLLADRHPGVILALALALAILLISICARALGYA